MVHSGLSEPETNWGTNCFQPLGVPRMGVGAHAAMDDVECRE
jgi:hypothetical protein